MDLRDYSVRYEGHHRAVSRCTRGYKFTIVFHPFVSSLEEINSLMRSIWVRK